MVQRGRRFRYDGFTVDASHGELRCTYSLDDRQFTERFVLSSEPAAWEQPAATAAARLVFLLAGVSYYKTAAPPVIDLGDTALTALERGFLLSFYLEGLGEFAFRNGLDLTGLRIEGPVAPDIAPIAYAPAVAGRPLVPFGGGIDSVVVVEHTKTRFDDVALFVASRLGDTFAAIEEPAAVTGVPVLRAGREIDEQVLRSAELGFLNGHVPVTGILSALAVLTAVLDGRDSVVMSNEWSASSGTVEVDGRSINHQYSKSWAFEQDFRSVLASNIAGIEYFSALRPYSELWVAERFAELEQYHLAFRSCNRAFTIDPARRLDHWCGRCDKCVFIDLVLAPFVAASRLRQVFAGAEPLDDPSLADRFRGLLGDDLVTKPFECVGEVTECHAAVTLAAIRPDRTQTNLLHELAAEVEPQDLVAFLKPMGPHAIPPAHAVDDLLV
ncbi:MAG: endonuclease domain-containing protein [Frankiales bacterium]|nr:endonuclease domain-containing protein [Frankiales bacterium]